MTVPISLVSCNSYGSDEVFESVKKAVDLLGGIKRFVKKGDKVLLKPNLLTASSPETCVTTHPMVIEAVALLVKEAGGIVYIGDSPGGKSDPEHVAKATGVLDICEKIGATFVDFRKASVRIREKNQVLKKMLIASIIEEMDVIINLPKFKTHSFTVFTGAVKNCFGCIPGNRKTHLHLKYPGLDEFSLMLLDVYQTIQPTLSIMDAVIGMDGHGPQNGNPKKVGAIIAGIDAVALDTICCRMAGIKLSQVRTISLARKMKTTDPDIKIEGSILENFKIRKFRHPVKVNIDIILPSIMKKASERFLDYPKIDKKRCIGCGICRSSCPAKAIHIESLKAIIDYKKCIRCLCCQEMCPHDAIPVRTPIVGKTMNSVSMALERLRKFFK